MLLSKTVDIKVTKRNISKYNKFKGYENIKFGDKIALDIKHLSKGSHMKVDIQCDYCGKHINIEYRNYIKGIKEVNKYPCSNKKCISKKIKDVCLSKYGVENPFQAEFVKDKTKQTMERKYGVEHPMYIDETKEKIKKTSLERYGETSYTKTEDYKKKTTKTNLEKYGVEYYLQSDDIKSKTLATNLEKYGVEHISQSEEFRKSVEKTSFEKWGYKCNLQSPEVIETIRQTNISKYGVDNIMKCDDFRKIYNISNHKDYLYYLNDGISVFNCSMGHTFSISSSLYISRNNKDVGLCTICNEVGGSSIVEKDVFTFIQNNYNGNIIENYRDKFEVDIYLPDLKIGIEFNGLFWHSSKYREKNYHIDKTNYFKERDIDIIHIWEDDWNFKQDIVKSILLNKIGITPKRIYARKCEIKEINNKISKVFLDNNHIQGSDKSKIKLGLYYNNELVSLMTFNKSEGRKIMKESEWNLSRFCNSLNVSVIGGASKLLKYFIKKYTPKRIISYADNDWSKGNLYNKLGFEMISKTKPDYKYIHKYKRIHKSNFQKKKLEKMFNEKIECSETEFLTKKNIYKIWDCGKMKYELYMRNGE